MTVRAAAAPAQATASRTIVSLPAQQPRQLPLASVPGCPPPHAAAPPASTTLSPLIECHHTATATAPPASPRCSSVRHSYPVHLPTIGSEGLPWQVLSLQPPLSHGPAAPPQPLLPPPTQLRCRCRRRHCPFGPPGPALPAPRPAELSRHRCPGRCSPAADGAVVVAAALQSKIEQKKNVLLARSSLPLLLGAAAAATVSSSASWARSGDPGLEPEADD